MDEKKELETNNQIGENLGPTEKYVLRLLTYIDILIGELKKARQLNDELVERIKGLTSVINEKDKLIKNLSKENDEKF
jgi:hypothetical protein